MSCRAPRRASHPYGPGSRRASQWYRCRSAAKKRPPGLRFGVGYRCYLKLGARYYNPTTGRFTQPDPAALIGGYAYAGDNPANATDPTGLNFDACWGEGIGYGVLTQYFTSDFPITGMIVGWAVAGVCGTSIGETNNGYNPILGPSLPTQRVQSWD